MDAGGGAGTYRKVVLGKKSVAGNARAAQLPPNNVERALSSDVGVQVGTGTELSNVPGSGHVYFPFGGSGTDPAERLIARA